MTRDRRGTLGRRSQVTGGEADARGATGERARRKGNAGRSPAALHMSSADARSLGFLSPYFSTTAWYWCMLSSPSVKSFGGSAAAACSHEGLREGGGGILGCIGEGSGAASGSGRRGGRRVRLMARCRCGRLGLAPHCGEGLLDGILDRVALAQARAATTRRCRARRKRARRRGLKAVERLDQLLPDLVLLLAVVCRWWRRWWW